MSTSGSLLPPDDPILPRVPAKADQGQAIGVSKKVEEPTDKQCFTVKGPGTEI